MKIANFIFYFGVILVFGLVVYYPGKKLARVHVNNKTEVNDHPLKCSSCHLYTNRDGFISKFITEDYYSPFNLAVSKNGKRLYVVAQDTNELLVIDVENNKVVNKISVGQHPHSVILNNKSSLAYVSNQWSDNVTVIDLDSETVVDTIKTGNGPSGIELSIDENFIYIANTFSSDLSVINLVTKQEKKRLITGNNPTGTALSPNGEKLYITSRRVNPAPYGEPLISDLTLVNTKSQKVIKYEPVESAYLMENIAFTPSGDLAITTLIRPKNNITSLQVEDGWMMTHGIGIVEQKENGKVVQLLLDEQNNYYPDPFDIVITPNGKKAFVSNAGVNFISVIAVDSIRAILKNSTAETLKRYANNLGISNRFVIKRISTGANPKGLALSPDGKKLYVAEMLEDKIGVIDTETLETIKTISLGGPKRISFARKGRRLFNNASHTFQNQYSCYTCHPDTHEDGLNYNFAGIGRDIVNTISLREIEHTAPFKWNGKNQSIYKQDGIRFSKFLTRTEQFNYEDLDALVTYIKTSIKHPPNLLHNINGDLTASQLKGKELFERIVDNFGNVISEKDRCITCHPPPLFTNFKMADVDTKSDSDASGLFDTPQLVNIFASEPYLHDGKAKTLEEIWTVYGEHDKHGRVNDMSKMQLNDLVDYLKSFRGADYENTSSDIQQVSTY
jgi:YVTN family beta-propeller protein